MSNNSPTAAGVKALQRYYGVSPADAVRWYREAPEATRKLFDDMTPPKQCRRILERTCGMARNLADAFLARLLPDELEVLLQIGEEPVDGGKYMTQLLNHVADRKKADAEQAAKLLESPEAAMADPEGRSSTDGSGEETRSDSVTDRDPAPSHPVTVTPAAAAESQSAPPAGHDSPAATPDSAMSADTAESGDGGHQLGPDDAERPEDPTDLELEGITSPVVAGQDPDVPATD